MINNVSSVDIHQPMNVAKATTSRLSNPIPPILGFKTPLLKEKAILRVKKFSRSDNITIIGEIEDDYVDIVEEDIPDSQFNSGGNFFLARPDKRKMKYLKNCYIIDYIQSPKMFHGLGTDAVKGLAEKAMFDKRAEGRIVTFSAPVWKESSPALFFYKLGFRFIDPAGNEYMEKCLRENTLDLPPQTGMMYLPRVHLHKLLRYGDMF